MPADPSKSLLHPLDYVGGGVPAEGQSLSPNAHQPDYKIDPTTGCWEWQKFKLVGYGATSFFGKTQRAHRAYYQAAYGPIPEGYDVHHKCVNPGCVNPEHLEAVPPGPHRQAHHQFNSTLTWDDVDAMRAAFKAGEITVYELAEFYGIGKSQVHNILTGHNWPDPNYEPGRLAECAECGDKFTATKSNQRFCCSLHRRRWNARRTWRRANWGTVERDAA